jgi:hypothetical protein
MHQGKFVSTFYEKTFGLGQANFSAVGQESYRWNLKLDFRPKPLVQVPFKNDKGTNP